MKSLILPFIMFLTVLIVWGIFLLYTQSSAARLMDSMENVYICAKSGDWEQSEDYNGDFLRQWDKYEKIYSLYIESTYLNDIRLSAERCLGYIESENRSLAMGESASILSHIELLEKNDTIEIGNLF